MEQQEETAVPVDVQKLVRRDWEAPWRAYYGQRWGRAPDGFFLLSRRSSVMFMCASATR